MDSGEYINAYGLCPNSQNAQRVNQCAEDAVYTEYEELQRFFPYDNRYGFKSSFVAPGYSSNPDGPPDLDLQTTALGLDLLFEPGAYFTSLQDITGVPVDSYTGTDCDADNALSVTHISGFCPPFDNLTGTNHTEPKTKSFRLKSVPSEMCFSFSLGGHASKRRLEQQDETSKMRKLGACLRCKLLKIQVSFCRGNKWSFDGQY